MGKTIILAILVMLCTCVISADIIINQQPYEVYNLGDTIDIPVTIRALGDISGSFEMNLLCGNDDINFYRNGVQLLYGEEQKMNPSLILTNEIIGEILGPCRIKASLVGEEPVLTDEFQLSSFMDVEVKSGPTEFVPGQSIFIEGYVTKENSKEANGFIELKIISSDDSEKSHLETVNNGFFSANISLPKDAEAGEYLIKLNAYERNFLGQETNKGDTEHIVSVIQVPTNLELVFEDEQVEPGTEVKVAMIIHDQTGKNIHEGSVIIKIKDKTDLILEQTQKNINDVFQFPIPYNEAPGKWTILATSGKLKNEATFEIIEKEDVKVEVINKTLTITNIGNVFYNDRVLVKIGNQSLGVDVSLDVDESQKYILRAPDGEYEVIVLADGETYSESAVLTGKVIDVSEAREGVVTLIRYPIVWIFVIGVMGFITFMIVKKGYKRAFFGYIRSKKKPRKTKVPLRQKSLINTSNKSELSLSIKGDKQNISLVCLKIKNLKEIERSKSNAEETLQGVVDASNKYKAAVYENQDSIFFLLAPVKTKTFNNEKAAIDLAQKIQHIIIDHNKLAKQKIDFGLSINYGTIIAKQQSDVLMFMSMGTLITQAKKIASLSDKEIFLSEKIKDKLKSDVKTEKHTSGNVSFYTVKEIKNREDNKKFIKNFLNRIEGKD